jgi:hypothetical protein
MNYRVTINIDQINHEANTTGNIDVHEVVMLRDFDQAMKIWNWIVTDVEKQVAAADYRLFG